MRAYFDGGPSDGQTMELNPDKPPPEVLFVRVPVPMEIWLKDMETVPGVPPTIAGEPAAYLLSAAPVPGQQDVIYVYDDNEMEDGDDFEDDVECPPWHGPRCNC